MGVKVKCPCCGEEVSIDYTISLPTHDEFICKECARVNINRETQSIVEHLNDYEVKRISCSRVITWETGDGCVRASIIRADGKRIDKTSNLFSIKRMKVVASIQAQQFELREE